MLMQLFIFSLVAFFGGEGAPRDGGGLTIVVGNDTSNSYPFLVSLQVRKQHVCGGTLIRPDTVLTAWHCVQGRKPSDFNVVAGVNRLADAVDSYAVTRVAHPSGDFDPKYDVALVRLSSNATLRAGLVETVSVPLSSPVTVGTVLTEVGWGLTTPGGGASPVLREATTTVREFDDALGMLNLDARACSGDSGGPVIYTRPTDGAMFPVGLAYAVTKNGPCFETSPSSAARDKYVNFNATFFNQVYPLLVKSLA